MKLLQYRYGKNIINRHSGRKPDAEQYAGSRARQACGFPEKLTTAVFACAAAAVVLITLYRSLPETAVADETAGMQGEAVTADGDGTAERAGTGNEDASGLFKGIMTAETVLQETEFTDPEEIKRVALTFDDGPHPVYTPELLDGLKERGVRATFFVIGKNIPGNEDIIRRMDEEGHLIGNHTYDHVKISDLSVEEACEQVEKTSALIREITGNDTEYVRPPFGSWDKDLECSFEMFPVLWNVDPLDWTTKNTGDVVRRVLEAVEPDDIILLHDCYESSVEAALQIVDALTGQGYVFVTVDELILE